MSKSNNVKKHSSPWLCWIRQDQQNNSQQNIVFLLQTGSNRFTGFGLTQKTKITRKINQIRIPKPEQTVVVRWDNINSWGIFFKYNGWTPNPL